MSTDYRQLRAVPEASSETPSDNAQDSAVSGAAGLASYKAYRRAREDARTSEDFDDGGWRPPFDYCQDEDVDPFLARLAAAVLERTETADEVPAKHAWPTWTRTESSRQPPVLQLFNVPGEDDYATRLKWLVWNISNPVVFVDMAAHSPSSVNLTFDGASWVVTHVARLDPRGKVRAILEDALNAEANNEEAAQLVVSDHSPEKPRLHLAVDVAAAATSQVDQGAADVTGTAFTGAKALNKWNSPLTRQETEILRCAAKTSFIREEKRDRHRRRIDAVLTAAVGGVAVSLQGISTSINVIALLLIGAHCLYLAAPRKRFSDRPGLGRRNRLAPDRTSRRREESRV